MGFQEAIRTCVKEKYATFRGRASRSEYWYFLLFAFLVAGIPLMIGGIMMAVSLDTASGPSTLAYVLMGIGGLVYLALLIPTIAVYVRRFHDRDLSGWWVLAVLVGGSIPYVGVLISIAAFVITVLKGTDGENRFGPDPLRAQNQADIFA